MLLRPVERTDVPVVAAWLADAEVSRWLDFGAGQQSLSAGALAVMLQRDLHCLRLIEAQPDRLPVGLVALSNIAPGFRTATLWYVLGECAFRGRGYATRAVAGMLACGFAELGLEAINAWVVETNAPSLRVLEKNGFRPIGRQRRCHWIDGRVYDRLWFDLLATEFDPARAVAVDTGERSRGARAAGMTTVPGHPATCAGIATVFAEDLHVDVPSFETDLIGDGLLDSLMFVDLLVHLERRFGVTIPLEDIEIDSFRSISQIAGVIERRRAAGPVGGDQLETAG